MRTTTLCLLVCCCLGAACTSRKVSNEAAYQPHKSAGSVADNIVSLPDGTTMVVEKGSAGRDLIEWANRGGRDTHHFELGGKQFVGKSVEPTGEARARLQRFVALMEAHNEVQAKVVGYTDAAGEAAENRRISEERARHVVDDLVKAGVARSRLSFEGRGGAEPIGDNATEDGRSSNERVALELTKTA